MVLKVFTDDLGDLLSLLPRQWHSWPEEWGISCG